ncbi:expressed protein [Phakopsora pachyrhizi]|uniref:Expressed protein n=1 Tax=Phakopsora pachyrhizi TaxID=170000 RepID=A0AAV0BBC8_PHAPC|nr:expressed protein [Phakopsora pachyrhizi]
MTPSHNSIAIIVVYCIVFLLVIRSSKIVVAPLDAGYDSGSEPELNVDPLSSWNASDPSFAFTSAITVPAPRPTSAPPASTFDGKISYEPMVTIQNLASIYSAKYDEFGDTSTQYNIHTTANIGYGGLPPIPTRRPQPSMKTSSTSGDFCNNFQCYIFRLHIHFFIALFSNYVFYYNETNY